MKRNELRLQHNRERYVTARVTLVLVSSYQCCRVAVTIFLRTLNIFIEWTNFVFQLPELQICFIPILFVIKVFSWIKCYTM